MKLRAGKVPFSSITGQSIMLTNETGQVVGQLHILNPFPSRKDEPGVDQEGYRYRVRANELADLVINLINRGNYS